MTTNRLAYACVYAPDAVPDLPTLIQVCERSVPALAGGERVVGAALYRAGRYKQALERFQQSHKVFQPRAWDWLFLAMIHSRLGHPSEARRFLQQADQWIVEADMASNVSSNATSTSVPRLTKSRNTAANTVAMTTAVNQTTPYLVVLFVLLTSASAA